MKKQLSIMALVTLLFATTAVANEPTSDTEENLDHRHKQEKVYLVVKGLSAGGDTITEGEAKVEGKNGKGFGVDIGYRTGYGINLELDYAYADVDITETTPTEETKATGKYHSFSLDLLYAYHITKPFAVFVKTGVEYEKEKISKLNVDKSDTGVLYGAGLEYEFMEEMAFIVEYEDSTIDGPRGYSIAAGLVIGLDILP